MGRPSLRSMEVREIFVGEQEQYLHHQPIDALLQPYQEQYQRLQSIPGIGPRTATVLIAELGVRMEVFPTAGHAAAWAGLCPANKVSAGKNLDQKVRKGNPHLRTALVEAAWGAKNKKDSYLRDKFRRLCRRRKKRAAVAIAHKLLLAAYHVMRTAIPTRIWAPTTWTTWMSAVQHAI